MAPLGVDKLEIVTMSSAALRAITFGVFDKYIFPLPEEVAEIVFALTVRGVPRIPIPLPVVSVKLSTSSMATTEPLLLVIVPPATMVTSFAVLVPSGSALASIAPANITLPPAFTKRPTGFVPSPSPFESRVMLLRVMSPVTESATPPAPPCPISTLPSTTTVAVGSMTTLAAFLITRLPELPPPETTETLAPG